METGLFRYGLETVGGLFRVDKNVLLVIAGKFSVTGQETLKPKVWRNTLASRTDTRFALMRMRILGSHAYS